MLALAMVTALLIAFAMLMGCRPAAVPIVAPAPVATPCLITPPPAKARWHTTAECVPGRVCLLDADARALVGEVEAERDWARAAWLACGPR